VRGLVVSWTEAPYFGIPKVEFQKFKRSHQKNVRSSSINHHPRVIVYGQHITTSSPNNFEPNKFPMPSSHSPSLRAQFSVQLNLTTHRQTKHLPRLLHLLRTYPPPHSMGLPTRPSKSGLLPTVRQLQPVSPIRARPSGVSAG
jgi:hypothetical protein